MSEDKNKLLPCKCGIMPQIKKIGNDYTSIKAIVIQCPNCYAKEKAQSIDQEGFVFEYLTAKATIEWNTRNGASND